MSCADHDQGAWAELRTKRDDSGLGTYVRLLLNAFERSDQAGVRAQSQRLLLDWPLDLAVSRALLVRLKDVGR
jgi:hypothetical protein